MTSISQLEYAIAVDTHRHFARAAKACHVTQPTLSAQLAKLEDEIGVILFDRSAQPIVPTSEGLAILSQARIVVAEFRKIAAIASGAAQEVAGELIVGVIPTVAPYLVPLFLEDFSRAHQKLKIDVREMTTAQITEGLARETIDVGILAIPVEGINFSTRFLYREPFYLYANKSHQLAQGKKVKGGDIDGKDLWLLEEGHCLRGQVLQACQIKGRKPALANVRFESGSVETLKQLVRQGIGYTLIPHLAIGEEDDVKVISFEDPMPARDIGLMFRREQLKKPATEALEKSIQKMLPRSLTKLAKDTIGLAVRNQNEQN
jgi:LysR family transcriptional regulator, hydrogen peroxide-inducible genes activator